MLWKYLMQTFLGLSLCNSLMIPSLITTSSKIVLYHVLVYIGVSMMG